MKPARAFLAVLLVLAILAAANPVWAQSQTQTSPTPAQNGQRAPVPAEAGGPTGDIGPYSVPKKKPEPPPERPKPPKNPPEIGEFSITKDVPVVNVDVMVTTKDGQFIPGLKKDNFRIYEDGVPQTISNFGQSEAPITAVLLVEFASTTYSFMLDALRAAYTFASILKPEDWVAVVSYDIKPYILVDFTQDKNAVMGALNQLRIPGFSETNLFDALYDTLDRLDGVEGRKYVILVSSGCDSFSKLTYDKVLKKVQAVHDISIYAISTGQYLRELAEARGILRALPCTGQNFDENVVRTDFLQADNQMRTFARMTGGRAYFPRFEGEFPEIFRDVASSIRNQYTLAYHPTNTKLDGTYRKLKVEVVDPQTGKPIVVRDQHGKTVKYVVMAREGYTAKHTVE
jgi:VWFA-related protein